MNANGSSETIPLESSEVEPFTPPSLANLPAPPVFKLRAAGKREFRKYQFIMRAEGLEYHSPEEIRAETLRAIKALYSGDVAAQVEARLVSYWARAEQKVEVAEEEQAAVSDLTERLLRAWPPLSRLGADNMRFGEESLRIAVSMFLVGWSKLDLAYRREEGRTPLDLIDDLEDKLQEIEKQAKEDKVEGVVVPGLAFIELANACYRRLHLTGSEEKNSSSPPPLQPIPNGSTTTRSEPTGAASSKASASSGSKGGSSAASKAGSRSRRGAAASAA